jgi:endonuclease YncB( thermonuclease family)
MITTATFALVTLLSVHDGDTLSVTVDGLPPIFGENIRVRMRGIDAPDLTSKSKCEAKKAIEAREFVRKLLVGKRITLNNVWRDKYFRLLADVEVDGKKVSDQLLKQNLAVPYYGLKKPIVDWCSKK